MSSCVPFRWSWTPPCLRLLIDSKSNFAQRGSLRFKSLRGCHMCERVPKPKLVGSLPVVVLCLIWLSISAGAQDYKGDYSNQRSNDARKSRAEQEAEAKVAFSPQIIIEILRNEPGSLLH